MAYQSAPYEPSASIEGWAVIAAGESMLCVYLTTPEGEVVTEPIARLRRFLSHASAAVERLEGQSQALPSSHGTGAPVGVAAGANGAACRRGGHSGHRQRAALTAGQLKVMRFLNEGLSAKEVARRLTCSPKTVRTQVRRVIVRLEERGFTVRGTSGALAILRSLQVLNESSFD